MKFDIVKLRRINIKKNNNKKKNELSFYFPSCDISFTSKEEMKADTLLK